jgi:hypothetical protein
MCQQRTGKAIWNSAILRRRHPMLYCLDGIAFATRLVRAVAKSLNFGNNQVHVLLQLSAG